MRLRRKRRWAQKLQLRSNPCQELAKGSASNRTWPSSLWIHCTLTSCSSSVYRRKGAQSPHARGVVRAHRLASLELRSQSEANRIKRAQVAAWPKRWAAAAFSRCLIRLHQISHRVANLLEPVSIRMEANAMAKSPFGAILSPHISRSWTKPKSSL